MRNARPHNHRHAMVGICFFVSVLALQVHADDAYQSCERLSEIAKEIMIARQSGLAMADMMEVFGGNGELGRAFTIAAFDVPRYSGSAMRQQAISDFGDQAYLGCAKSVRAKAQRQK